MIEVSEVSVVPHPAVPEKMIAAVGVEATNEILGYVDQRLKEAAATKVDRNEYDAHAAVIEEKFKRFELEMEKKRGDAKREIILWTVGLITAITGGWTALLVSLLK